MPKASYFIASHILVRSEEEYYFIWKTSNNSNSQRLMVKEIDKKDKNDKTIDYCEVITH